MSIRLTGLLAVIAAAAAVFLLMPKEREPEDSSLFADFTLERANAVDRIRLYSSGAEIELRRDGEGVWRVPAAEDYPADTVQVRKILAAVLDAEKVEPKTAEPDYYGRLGVEYPEDAESSGSGLLRLKTPEQEWNLIIGKPSAQLSGGQYVRIPDEAQSWLINRRIEMTLDVADWLETEILRIRNDELREMTFDYEGEKISVSRTEFGGELLIENPNSLDAQDRSYRIGRLASVVENLRFKRLMPADTRLAKKSKTASASYITYEGMTVLIDVHKQDDLTFFTVRATVADDAGDAALAESLRISQAAEDRIYEAESSLNTAMLANLKNISGSLGEPEEKASDSQ